jgi:hypothetical protein
MSGEGKTFAGEARAPAAGLPAAGYAASGEEFLLTPLEARRNLRSTYKF